MNNVVYVVHAFLWGDRMSHSYIEAVFSNQLAAIEFADEHAAYRGGKYECCVVMCHVDYDPHHHESDEGYEEKNKEVYSTDKEK